MNSAGRTLQSIEIFSDLRQEDFDVLRSIIRERNCKKGELIFNQNDPGKELFIVESGCIAIEVELPDGKKLELSEIESGNFFGEMSIFEDAPRSATCRTKKLTTLYSLHQDDFFRLMRKHPEIAAKIMYRMLNITASRLKNTDKFLSDMVQWGEVARKRAVTDEFTGLYNRRFLEDALEEQFSKAKMENYSLAIAMVDLDHFGELNKEYGEKKGDEVILEAVRIFRSVCEKTDILIRYGGDEFTFIMPRRNNNNAKEICDTICAELNRSRVLEGLSGKIRQITSSIGVGVFPENGISPKEIMEKADSALYTAKERGRNRAVLASTS